MPRAARKPAPRFGIGEWFGRSFVKLTPAERRQMADTAQRPQWNNPPCPFKPGGQICHKKGGVCSLRLYKAETSLGDGKWTSSPVDGPEGDLRVLCPTRFRQGDAIYQTVGLTVLGNAHPKIASEIRFLQRDVQVEVAEEGAAPADDAKEDVGNIDNVLVMPDTDPLKWCALEIQAVYFSGPAMGSIFPHIKDFPNDELPFPDKVRRPDYRSSGPKRLMPQLQIKVPTLRRWGKKMAVVVDAAFYRNMGRMDTVNDLSNADIAWFTVTFDTAEEPTKILIGAPEKQTLERAVEGLTGGLPVTLSDFESKIVEKLAD